MAAQPETADFPTVDSLTTPTSGAAPAPTPSPLRVPASRAEGRNLADRAPFLFSDHSRVPPASQGSRAPSGARSAGQHAELFASALLMLVLAVAGAAAVVCLDRYLDARDEARSGTIGMRAGHGFEGSL